MTTQRTAGPRFTRRSRRTWRTGKLPDGLTEEEFDCAVAVEAFLRRHVAKVLAVELTVLSITHEYAGTLDLWALGRDGHTYLLDWKTSGDVYTDHAVQLAAYANAEYAVANKRPTSQAGKEAERRAHRMGPEKAERLGIVHVRPDGVSSTPASAVSNLDGRRLRPALIKI